MPEMRRVPIGDSGADPEQDHSPPEPPTCECPFLEADDWHEVESDWSDITFLQTKVPAVMGVVLKYAAVKDQLAKLADSLGATIREDAMLLLGEGRMRRPVMLEVEPGRNESKKMARPGGIAFTQLVSAPPGLVKKTHRAAVEVATSRYGRSPDTMWSWYLTCGVCSGDRDYETLFVAHYAHAPKARG